MHFPDFKADHCRRLDSPQTMEVVRAFFGANKRHRGWIKFGPERTIRIPLTGKREDYDLRSVWTVARSHRMTLKFDWTKDEPPPRSFR
jgi:hypothetical protein